MEQEANPDDREQQQPDHYEAMYRHARQPRRSPDAAMIRNTRAPGPHGGAQALARTVENWWGEAARRFGGQPRPVDGRAPFNGPGGPMCARLSVGEGYSTAPRTRAKICSTKPIFISF